MENFNFQGSLPVSDGHLTAQLSVFSFIEDGVVLMYAPALDIVGSGYDSNQAKASFWETVSEFFRYTTQKKTLAKELKRLGWQIKGGKKKMKITAPDFADLYQTNEELQDIITNKNYSSHKEVLELPNVF
ncbi:MAG: hypothetical protein JSS76_19640 [Bacteroidetes bacterium]|nr:hypothetical protein [Bacteroidota bacterium]